MKMLVRWTMVMLMLIWASGAFAFPIVYTAQLDGPSESPPVASPGTGFAQVDFDIVAHTMRVQVEFSGLVGTTTVSHIHAPTATPGVGTIGVAVYPGTFPGFPAGVTSGTYEGTFDTNLATAYTAAFLTTYGGGTVEGAEAALAAYLAEGRAYFNIHTSFAPGGEIRGFLTVPEPTTILLLGLGLMGLAGIRRTDENDPSRSA